MSAVTSLQLPNANFFGSPRRIKLHKRCSKTDHSIKITVSILSLYLFLQAVTLLRFLCFAKDYECENLKYLKPAFFTFQARSPRTLWRFPYKGSTIRLKDLEKLYIKCRCRQLLKPYKNSYDNHNYIKILESDWSSAALIWAVIVQLYASCLSNWTVRVIKPALVALEWVLFQHLA